MQLKLSENIRSLRKEHSMTQEQLANALGVTVGAVYKWEAGLSVPEIRLLMEMADLFDTSVDVLLGYKMKDNRLDAALERMESYFRTMDPAAVTEAEKILAKHPNSFRAVYGCGETCLVFGSANHDPALLRRAKDLLEQSRGLLPQNEDRRISDSVICGNISLALFLLGEREKSLEMLKQNNAGGIFSSEIATMLAVFMGRPEEASEFLSEALLNGIFSMINAIVGYVFLFRSRGDWASALDIVNWGIGFLSGLKTEARPDSLEKMHAELLALLAYVQAKSGMREESFDTLKKARSLALRFDSMPDYSVGTLRFAEHSDRSIVFDILGAGALGSVGGLIGLIDDKELSDLWKELTKYEQ